MSVLEPLAVVVVATLASSETKSPGRASDKPKGEDKDKNEGKTKVPENAEDKSEMKVSAKSKGKAKASTKGQTKDKNDGKERNRQCGRIAHIKELEALFIDVQHNRPCCITWATTGQNLRLLKDLQRTDDANHQQEQNRWRQQG